MKTTLNHTPGPWRVKSRKGRSDGWHEGDFYHRRIESDDSMIICELSTYSRIKCDGEREANARLMTASPELLEACENALAFLDEIEWSEGGGKAYQEVLTKLTYAVTLAKHGRSVAEEGVK